MGIEGLALMFGPLGLGLPAAKAEELATEIAGSPLTLVSPVLGFALPVLNAIIDSGPLSNPLFRAANDNAAPTNAQEAVDGIIENLDAAQTLIDEEKWDEAGAVLDGVRKTYFADLPKAQRDTFWKESPRYALLMAESRRMQALVFQKQGKFEQAQSIVEASLGFFREEYMDELDGDERAEALLVRGKLKDLGGDTDGAKKDFESAAAINPDYQAQVDEYQKALDAFEEEGEKRMIELAKQAAKDGCLPADKCPPELSAYISRTGDEIEFTEAYKTLSESEKVVVFQNLLKVARLEKMRKGAETETDPLKKLFLEGQVALTDGNLALAQVKMAAFKAESKDSKAESILAMRKQVRLELRTLALGAITRLEGYNEALVQQRRNNPEMLLSGTESTYRHNKNYLAGLKGIIEEGRFDTIDEAIGAYKNLGSKQDKAYRDTNIIGSIVSTSSLNWKQPRMGSDEFWAMKKSDNEVSAAYHQLEWDSKLFEADAFPDTAYIRLEGGTYKAPPPSMYDAYPNVIRVVVGKEGGELLTMDRKRVSFPASDHETVVLLKGGNLEAAYPQLKQNKDYFMEPTPFIEIGFVDDDFDALLKMESLDGLSKMQDPSERREYLLGVVQDIRERNGSYVVAGTILEELLAKDMETAVDAIPEADRKAAVVEVNSELDDTKSEVRKQLDRMKEEEPTAWAARFPDGDPSQEEIDAMVDMAQKEKLSCKLKRMAFERISESYDDGTLTDPISRKAWDVYNDMKDPLDEFWNISDDTGDRIVDEVVITVVTLPLTMGAGKLAHVGLEGCVWMSRLARMGRIGAFSARALTMTGVAVTEGLVQQAANPVTVLQILHDLNDPSAPSAFRMDQQLRDFGWGVMVSFAFHGGAGLWKRGAQALKIEKNAVANLGGTFTTQTLLSSGLGEFEAVLFDHDAPGTFFERIGGHAARMVGRHYGTQTFHLATGGQFRQTESKAVKVEPAKRAPEPIAKPVVEPVLVAAKQAPAKPNTNSQTVTVHDGKKNANPDDVATGVKTVDKKVTDSEINRIADQNDAIIREAQKLAREQKLKDGQYYVQTVHSTQLLGVLRDAGVRTRVTEISKRSDTIGEQAREFQKLARTCEDSLVEFQKLNTDYQKAPTPEKRAALDTYYETTLGKAMGDLKDSPHYKLHEAYEARANKAYLELKPVLFALKGPRVKFTPLEKLPIDPADPIGSMEKMAPELMVQVDIPAVPAPKAQPAPSPQNALYGVSGPAGVYGLLTAHGVPQSIAVLGAGIALAVPILGMAWSVRPKPQVLTPHPTRPTSIQDNPANPPRVLIAPTANGLMIVDGPMGSAGRGGITLNGKSMTNKWVEVPKGQKIEIEVDGSVYEVSNAAAFQGSVPSTPALGQVVVAKDGNNRLMIAIEGSGRAPGQKTADAEAQEMMGAWIQQGYGLEQVIPGARPHVQQHSLNAKGEVVAGAPTVDATGVQLTQVADGYQATFVRNGKVEAAVIRLGDAKEAIFQAPEGKSSPEKPLRDGDVVVMGKFGEGLQSMWVVREIIKKTGTQDASVIQSALTQEAAIRTELLKIVPANQVIESRHYALAYERVTGQKPQFGFKGFYEGGYVLKSNGDVVRIGDTKPTDRFTAAPMPFQVQIVGK